MARRGYDRSAAVYVHLELCGDDSIDVGANLTAQEAIKLAVALLGAIAAIDKP
jgi:hypothetical protein